jgi:glycosyltransferase involved in cell wall biosynthesis
MRLTVLNVSYPLAPVSPATAGGAEQVLSMLDQALVHAGHRSIVIAPEGSRCAGLLVPTPAPASVLDERAKHEARREHRNALNQVLKRFPVDVVHLHGLDFMDYLPENDIPVVVTLHLPPAWYPNAAFRLNRTKTYLIGVSQSQLRSCPPEAQIQAVIENGVCTDQFRPGRKKESYVLGLGRICPEKAFHLGMDAASAAGVSYWLAGTVFNYPTHRQYFEAFIQPRLKRGHRYLGQVGGRRKQSLLAGAKCLLISSQAPETSSLTAMEALACGTPVIAFRSGAICELIEDGRTGFLVDTVEEMATAIPRAAALDPRVCRAEAEARFSADKMVRQHLALYGAVAGKALPKKVEADEFELQEISCCI